MQKSKLQIKIQNSKNPNFGLRFYLLIIGMMFLPSLVLASAVYIDTSHLEFFVGDTVLFSVRIDSEGKNINAVEGEVSLDHAAAGASLTDINTAGSKFSLWPGKPLPSEDNARISFIGGSPGGFIAKDAIVFNLVLKLKETGQFALSPDNIGVYLNDGQGTKDEVRVKNLVINVVPKISDAKTTDDWSTIISNDQTAPAPFEINLGQDPSIFDNRYFVGFFTTDEESGIAYYEVQEGKGDFVRTDSPYVLQDQSLKNLIKVKAIDKAGNERIEEMRPAASAAPVYKNILFWIVVFIIIVVIAYAVWRNFRRKINPRTHA